MTAREIELQESIVALLVQLLHPKQILLFGSRSKGDNRPNADFDIAVSGSQPAIEVQQKLTEKLEAITGLYKTDIVYLENVEDSFREIILSTGKVLYEKRD